MIKYHGKNPSFSRVMPRHITMVFDTAITR
jgi:hypothetical protein